jgi:hypothetical protein
MTLAREAMDDLRVFPMKVRKEVAGFVEVLGLFGTMSAVQDHGYREDATSSLWVLDEVRRMTRSSNEHFEGARQWYIWGAVYAEVYPELSLCFTNPWRVAEAIVNLSRQEAAIARVLWLDHPTLTAPELCELVRNLDGVA